MPGTPKKQEPPEVTVVIEEHAKHGDYSNFVRIQHSAMDFRFDFAKAIVDENTLIVNSRIFMSPIHAKMFFKALDDNIRKYEEQFGAIALNLAAPINFPGHGSTEKH
jgi:hypothetical protein